MATPTNRESGEDSASNAPPAETVVAESVNSQSRLERFQFSLTMLLLGMAVVAVAIRLSMASWLVAGAFAVLVAAFLRTRSFAKLHRCFRGHPARQAELARTFIWSAMLAIAILAVGLGIQTWAFVLTLLAFYAVGEPFPNPVLVGLISGVPAIPSMVLVAAKLWPVNPKARNQSRTNARSLCV
jgi:hypothetical protein